MSNNIAKEKIRLGQALRQARDAKGITQSAVGKELDVTGAYISLIEQGKEVPSQEFLRRIVQLYGETQVTYKDLNLRRQFISCAKNNDFSEMLKSKTPPIVALNAWIEQIPYEKVRDALRRIEAMHHDGLLSDETIELLGEKLFLDLEMLSKPRPNADLLLSEAGLPSSERPSMNEETSTEMFGEMDLVYSEAEVPYPERPFGNKRTPLAMFDERFVAEFFSSEDESQLEFGTDPLRIIENPKNDIY